MVVKNQIKFVKSLQQKKYRIQNQLFVAEGVKLVLELLNAGYRAEKVYCTDEDLLLELGTKAEMISASILQRMSGLKSPNKTLAVFGIPEARPLDYADWVLALDDVKDPGNLGTIIRLCDWFGVSQILCSPNTVDCYNPKVLQATMGSIARVNVIYQELTDILNKTELPVYGTYMDGKSIYEEEFPSSGIIVMGNEAHGISQTLQSSMNKKVAIPQYGNSDIESLNVATAAAILLNELRRPTRK